MNLRNDKRFESKTRHCSFGKNSKVRAENLLPEQCRTSKLFKDCNGSITYPSLRLLSDMSSTFRFPSFYKFFI